MLTFLLKVVANGRCSSTLNWYFFCYSMHLLQLRFNFNSAMTTAIKITIWLRFDLSKWASWQYVNEGMNSYQTTFHFRSVWNGYTNVDNRRMLPYMLICRRECHFYLRRDEKRNMFVFRRSLIEAESSQIVILIIMSQTNWSRIAIVIAGLLITGTSLLLQFSSTSLHLGKCFSWSQIIKLMLIKITEEWQTSAKDWWSFHHDSFTNFEAIKYI